MHGASIAPIDANTLRLRTDGLDWRELDEEIVALDLNQSEYFAVNKTGTVLWRELAGGATRRDLAEVLVTRFALSEEAAAADVDRFVENLERRRLLVTEDEQ